MAIIIEQEGKKTNWLVIAGIALIFIFLLVMTYYLFFSPTPLIEKIVPPELQRASELSEITIDAKSIREVLDQPVYKTLKPYVSTPAQGSFGRTNPFLPFF